MSFVVKDISVGPSNCRLNAPLSFRLKFTLSRPLRGHWLFEYITDATRRRHVVSIGSLSERDFSADDAIAFEVNAQRFRRMLPCVHDFGH